MKRFDMELAELKERIYYISKNFIKECRQRGDGIYLRDDMSRGDGLFYSMELGKMIPYIMMNIMMLDCEPYWPECTITLFRDRTLIFEVEGFLRKYGFKLCKLPNNTKSYTETEEFVIKRCE